MKRKILLRLILTAFVAVIFSPWWTSKEIIGGDWPYRFAESVKVSSLSPPAWSPGHGNGLGGVIVAYYLDQYLYLTLYLFANLLSIPWILVSKFFWFFLPLALGVFGIVELLHTSKVKVTLGSGLIASLVYLTNTYFLMISGGGQMGVVLAYGIAPLVLVSFIKFFDQDFSLERGNRDLSTLAAALVCGLLFGIQVIFDPRIAYATLIAIFVYTIFKIRKILTTLVARPVKAIFLIFPFLVSLILNCYWILPLLVMRTNPLSSLGQAYTSIGSLQFFSFADFSHVLSLLHPNWPENIFGKTYFLKPEFLVIPIIAFSSMVFLKKQLHILYFTLLALLGVFLAKGANPPFAGVFIWLYQNLPGFVMFRDPTKFYVLSSLSYAVLISFAIGAFSTIVLRGQRSKSVTNSILTLLFLFFWALTIRQALLGQLSGTFANHTVPQEYSKLKNQLVKDKEFYRTLWVPRQQRFTFGSSLHPAVEASPLVGSTSSAELIEAFPKESIEKLIEDIGVKYVIIPEDSLGEIFLEDRKYSQKVRDQFEKGLDNISWLKKISSGPITIYETPIYKDLFWLEGPGTVSYSMISPTEYSVLVNTPSETKLILAQNYNSGWMANNIRSVRTDEGLNSFLLHSGTTKIFVYFTPEKYYTLARWISLLTLISSLLGFFLLKWWGKSKTKI